MLENCLFQVCIIFVVSFFMISFGTLLSFGLGLAVISAKVLILLLPCFSLASSSYEFIFYSSGFKNILSIHVSIHIVNTSYFSRFQV